MREEQHLTGTKDGFPGAVLRLAMLMSSLTG